LDELDVAWAEWTWKGARGAASSRPHADATRLARDAAIAWRAGSAPEGADLGSSGERLGRSQWPPSLEARVDRLAPGEVSDPIETPWGVLVVRRGAAP
ncbi:MAG TPA: peptidylprolyl isomerase, partial [Myxococcota bacterium]|nr:peptidylprolyl isomerase [Myxococcota bacterium]